MKRVNKFCFGAIYNGRIWEKELGVSAKMQSLSNTNGDVNMNKQMIGKFY